MFRNEGERQIRPTPPIIFRITYWADAHIAVDPPRLRNYYLKQKKKMAVLIYLWGAHSTRYGRAMNALLLNETFN